MLKSNKNSDIKDSKEEPAKLAPRKVPVAAAVTGINTPVEFIDPKNEDFVPIRNEMGLLNRIKYPIKSNGLIDWRKLIPREHVVLNKYNFAARGVSLEDFSQEDIDRLIDESPEEDLVIKLAGFRELASIRGVKRVHPISVSSPSDGVTTTVIIDWIPNVENPEGFSFSATANASPSNTDEKFSKFLDTIAENRAFIRAVRHSLGIISLGQDEMKQDDLKAEAQTVKIQSLLAQHLEKYSLDINDLKEYAIKEGFEWNPKWVTVERIDPAAAMSFITVLKANSPKN
jgi:hypothetical protein